MNVPAPYIEYLIQFHATRDYFECHELLEEYWKENPNDGLGNLWVMCIQVAVGQYHERRGNRRGALKMYQSALHLLKDQPTELIAIHNDQLSLLLNQRIDACEQLKEYEDIWLPISDSALIEACRRQAEARGLIWGISSTMVSDDIIHRHTRRDRSDVIKARAAALRKKHEG